LESNQCRASCVSVLAARRDDHATESGVEYGHHLCAAGWRLCLFGGDYGLVQSLRAELGTLQQLGYELLPGGLRARAGRHSARYIQERAGRKIDEPGLDGAVGRRGRAD